MVEIATEFKEGMIFSETKNGKCPNTVLTLKILPCQLTFTRHRILFSGTAQFSMPKLICTAQLVCNWWVAQKRIYQRVNIYLETVFIQIIHKLLKNSKTDWNPLKTIQTNVNAILSQWLLVILWHIYFLLLICTILQLDIFAIMSAELIINNWLLHSYVSSNIKFVLSKSIFGE